MLHEKLRVPTQMKNKEINLLWFVLHVEFRRKKNYQDNEYLLANLWPGQKNSNNDIDCLQLGFDTHRTVSTAPVI